MYKTYELVQDFFHQQYDHLPYETNSSPLMFLGLDNDGVSYFLTEIFRGSAATNLTCVHFKNLVKTGYLYI